MTPGGPIFVTARFRSGSTLIWNLLRQVKGLTTYYEPCHDNLLAHIQADTPVQDSHRCVASYWDEYKPLVEELPALHRHEFGVTDLLLEAADEWPGLEKYIGALIERSPERPVLQFNRMDFRLPWLKARFPNATTIHLFRNPRDQWHSMTRGLPEDRRPHPDENAYDLVLWAVALSGSFPFLLGPHIDHSYKRHYLLWRLSYLMGRRLSDLSLSFDEDFCRHPETGAARLLAVAGVTEMDAAALIPFVEAPSPLSRPSLPLAGEFARMEDECDALLEQLGLVERFGLAPLAQIRRDHGSAWTPFEQTALAETARLGSRTFSTMRSKYIDIVRRLRELGVNARNVELALRQAEQELDEWKAASRS